MSTVTNKFFLGLAVYNAVLALGHTYAGLDMFQDSSLRRLPVKLRGAVKIGWYTVGGFIAIMGLVNYRWAYADMLEGYDKGINGMYTALLLGGGWSFYSSQGPLAGTLLSVLGILQGLAGWRAA